MDDAKGRTGRRRWLVPIAIAVVVTTVAATELGRVPPRAGAATEVHLTAAGDYGARATTATVLQKIADLDPDAHLALGDFAYTDVASENAWCSYVKARLGEGFPFELISGNHESLDQTNGLINNFSACLPNQVPGVVGTYGREYYMDFPPGAPLVRVIQASPKLTFEDGMWQYSAGDAHYNWLSNAIDSGRAKGAKWIIVTAHIPCWSLGIYACPSSTNFYQLLVDKKVDLVLHGHEHSYLRTNQLRSGVSGCPTIPTGTFNPACVADSDGDFIAGQGTIFATVGTGGMTLRDVDPTGPNTGYFAAYSGSNSNPTYGLLDLSITDSRLAARFIGTSGGNFTDSFTITKGTPPANQPPVASFTTQVQDRSVTVNGGASSDPDGTIASYSWDFGDGSTATGAAPAAHTYAAAGTYPVTLTVTDDGGANNTTTKSVTVSDAVPSTKLAEDQFGRTLASGWGNADTGGAWTLTTPTAFSVDGAEGAISVAKSSGPTAYLRGVTTDGSDVLVTFGTNKVATGSGLYLTTIGRSVVGAGDYRSALHFFPDGRISVRLARVAANGTDTTLKPEVYAAGITYAAGDRLQTRMQVTGTNPTTVRMKIWKVGTQEPSAWTLTTTDTTANLQAAGSTGLYAYLSSSATNSPITVAVDSYVVTKP
jgi:PKD repeat protein